MITDKLENIGKYKQIPAKVRKFLKNIPDTCGRYSLAGEDFANIEEYETKAHKDCYFETHKKYADVQILLKGKERLDYTDEFGLDVKTFYNEEKDIAFWFNSKKESASVYLDGTNFVLLMPDEAHRPQMNYGNKSEKVRKLVVKIKI